MRCLTNSFPLSLASVLGAWFLCSCGDDPAADESGPSSAGSARSGPTEPAEIPGMQDGEYWDGLDAQFSEIFETQDELLVRKEGETPFTGQISRRSAFGSLTSRTSYLDGKRHGDALVWHDNGRLASKTGYAFNLKDGYEILWTNNGIEYSRKYYSEGLEDLTKAPEDDNFRMGESPQAIALKEWSGNGSEFVLLFAGEPTRAGTLHIRETEELYNGTITALDDYGNKEAELHYENGRYHGMISKWDADGQLVEKAEFAEGNLVRLHVKDGQPFDPEKVIEANPFGM